MKYLRVKRALNTMSIKAGLSRFRHGWGSKKSRIEAVAVLFVLVAGVFTVFFPIGSLARRVIGSSRACHFPAIYNFGDSNSDTGSDSAAFGRLPPPYGQTFFGTPSGRYSDGRLTIDFIANELGLPYLSAYLDAIEGDFQHGVNFAASGSTIQPIDGKLYDSGFNPISLTIQISQFQQFKQRTNELYHKDKNWAKKRHLPDPSGFSKALYTFDIGQNDLHYALQNKNMTEDQVRLFIPNLIIQLASAMENLYRQGARKFWIHNTGPIGCLPVLLLKSPPPPENADQVGCIRSYNDIAEEFNKQLKDKVSQLRNQLQDSLLVYVDIYSAKYYLITEATKLGFIDPLGFCCKHSRDKLCWDNLMVNGTQIFANSCKNPSQYISWDSTHHTEAANKWVASQIFDGSLSEPPLPIAEACGNAVQLR